jgi:signal transduction histidine kinase
MQDTILEDVAAVNRIKAVPMILDVICGTTGMSFAAIARVTEDRWIACSVKDSAFGVVAGTEFEVETTLCHEIRQHRMPVVIDHVAEDPIYACHPTPALYCFQSYISVPIIRADGTFFGTLCAADPAPARVDTPEIAGMFKLFAELIAFHLDALDKMEASQADLAAERETAIQREQFIAVLGHDLRNPLAAIGAGAQILAREQLSEKGSRILGLIDDTVARMSGLIGDVLDLTRGRLGGGIALNRRETVPVRPFLDQVAAELRAVHPDRTVDTVFDLDLPVDCDTARIAQLFSNLLGNALSYGTPDKPVLVEASTADGRFELSVANAGEPIPPDAMERLFAPFSRDKCRPCQQGLGLGLYIASEIARAHGGTLAVVSTVEETRFTFRMPSE